MLHRISFAWLLGTLCSAIAFCQSFPADLIIYLNLTPAQVQSIVTMNNDFAQASIPQQKQFYDLQTAVTGELAKSAPDAAIVGDDYAHMEMLRRDYNTQLAQLQNKVPAVLTPAQITLVNALVDVARLREILNDADIASLVKLPPSNIPYYGYLAGGFGIGYPGGGPSIQPLAIALVNYLQLSEAQIAAIENANAGYTAYLSRQSLKIQELQYEIADLTAAPTIDAAKLGADYVTIAQIQHDETTQSDQLTSSVRSLITTQQQPQLATLDSAAALLPAVTDAVCNNLLVLPADVPFGYYYVGFNYGVITGLLSSPRPGGLPSNPFAPYGCIAATS